MKRKAIIITIIIALVATGALAATTISSKGKREIDNLTDAKIDSLEVQTREIKPVNVQTQTVSTARLFEYATATGTTKAKTDVTFSSEIPGRIEYIGTDLGRRVKKGQVLARIDFRTLKAQKDMAFADYELLKTTNDRLENLGADLVSRQKLDEANSAMISARANLAIAKDAISKIIVKSSVSGVVSAKLADKSEYVGPGNPLFRIVDYSTVIIEAQLAETEIAQIEIDSLATVTINALAKEFEGTVDAILPAANPLSKTFTVRIKVENPDLKILVGMSANVKIATRIHEDVVVVPQDTVIEGNDTRSIFVAVNGVAIKRTVRLGKIQGDRVVILNGLESGEELIVTGHRDLNNGQPIKVVR